MWRIWNSLDTIFDQFEWPEAARLVCKLFGGPSSHEDWLGEEFENGSTAELYRLIHPAQLRSDLTEELRSTTAPMMVLLGDLGPLLPQEAVHLAQRVTRAVDLAAAPRPARAAPSKGGP